MPVVQIDMWKGRTVEQKAELIKLLTKAFEATGTKPSSLEIIIHDIPLTNWGQRGEQVSKIYP